ncbi:MAG: hypothetical protein MUF37_02755 [Methanoregulaceae archaeon]|jgi:hypothetical protein|nr:hypothetical protein [Methanoregulaceae archaeon]
MKIKSSIVIFFTLAILLLSAGCTQAPALPQATTIATGPDTGVPTTRSTAIPTKVIVTTSTPGVVQTLPEEYAVEVQVASNGVSVDPKMITTFRGGRGINFVTQVEVVNTRGDGITENAVKSHPNVGDTIELTSSGGDNDRISVYVTISNGQRYLIFDRVVSFKQRG